MIDDLIRHLHICQTRLTRDCGLSRGSSGSGFIGPRDGAASGFSWDVPAGDSFSKQSNVKCSLQMVISVQHDSFSRCALTSNRNWTHSSLLSGSSGNLNRCTPRHDERHPTTEHVPVSNSVSSVLNVVRRHWGGCKRWEYRLLVNNNTYKLEDSHLPRGWDGHRMGLPGLLSGV